MRTNRNIGVILTALLVALLTLPVMGQATGQNGNGGNGGGQGGGQGGGGGGGGGGRRNFDPAQMMQRMMDRLKQQMGASDDEFAAIQPKIQKVMELERDANASPMGMFGRRGGFGGRNGQDAGGQGGATTQPTSPVQAATTDLRNTLDDQNSSADMIKTKLDALRQARAKAKDDLTAAQADLKSVLTQRQEAVLVLGGILE